MLQGGLELPDCAPAIILTTFTLDPPGSAVPKRKLGVAFTLASWASARSADIVEFREPWLLPPPGTPSSPKRPHDIGFVRKCRD